MAINLPVTTPGAKAAIGNLTAIRSLVLSIGAGFAAFAVGRGFVSAIKLMRDFEFTMSRVRAIAGSTDEDFRSLSNTARQLGATTVFSARQAAEGMTFLAQAGFDTKEIIDATAASLKLAQAGNLDLAESSDIVAKTIRQFGLEASEAGRVSDVLAKAAASSNTSVAQLGDAFRYVAPVGKALGLTLEQTAAAIGVVSDAGIQASQAGTGLRQAFLKLQKPSAEARVILDSIGLSQEFLTKNSNNLIGVFSRLRAANLSVAEAQQIFGIRSVTAGLAILDNVERIKELTDTLENSAGFAEEFASIVGDTLQGAFLSLRSGIEEAILQMGDTGFLRSVTNLTKSIALVVARINGMEEAFLGSNRITEANIKTADRLQFAFEALRAVIVAMTARLVVLRSIGLAQVFLAWAAAALKLRSAMALLGGVFTVALKAVVVAVSFFAFKEKEVLGQSVKNWQLWIINIKAAFATAKALLTGNIGLRDLGTSFRKFREEGVKELTDEFNRLKKEGDLRAFARETNEQLKTATEGTKGVSRELAEARHQMSLLVDEIEEGNIQEVGQEFDGVSGGLRNLVGEFAVLDDSLLKVNETTQEFNEEQLQELRQGFKETFDAIKQSQDVLRDWDETAQAGGKTTEELNNAIKDTERRLLGARDRIIKAREEIKKLNLALQQGEISVTEFRRGLEKQNQELDQATKSFSQAADSHNQFTDQLEENNRRQEESFKSVIKLAGDALNIFNEYQDAVNKRRAAQGDLQEIDRQITSLQEEIDSERDRGGEGSREIISNRSQELRELIRERNAVQLELGTTLSRYSAFNQAAQDGIGVLGEFGGSLLNQRNQRNRQRAARPSIGELTGDSPAANGSFLDNFINRFGGGNIGISVRNETGNRNTNFQVQSVKQTNDGINLIGFIRDTVDQAFNSGKYDRTISSRYHGRKRGY